jgi:hypothetical protein
MLGEHAFAEEDAHLTSKRIQELIVALVDATVDGDQMRLHALLVLVHVHVLRQPKHVTFLAAVRRSHYHEAIPP